MIIKIKIKIKEMNNLTAKQSDEIPETTGLTFEESEFLHECDFYETFDKGKLNAITIMTENGKGVFLCREDLKRLIEILNKYVQD